MYKCDKRFLIILFHASRRNKNYDVRLIIVATPSVKIKCLVQWRNSSFRIS